jgi:hypothetical protein
MKPRKTLERILGGARNVQFSDLVRLAEALGFRLSRVRKCRNSSTFRMCTAKRKPYQVRQLVSLVEKYNLQFTDTDQS